MKRWAKIVLLVLIILYFITRWARNHVDALPDFFRNHFTDLLFIPVQLIIALWGTRLLKRDPNIQISLVWIIVQVIFVSFLFEWYMPNYGADTNKFTGDFIDVLMYVVGGFLFVVFQQLESKKWNG